MVCTGFKVAFLVIPPLTSRPLGIDVSRLSVKTCMGPLLLLRDQLSQKCPTVLRYLGNVLPENTVKQVYYEVVGR